VSSKMLDDLKLLWTIEGEQVSCRYLEEKSHTVGRILGFRIQTRSVGNPVLLTLMPLQIPGQS
jgi:hypothetical protein